MKKTVQKKTNKKQVCSDVEGTNRCLLKLVELPEAFWFVSVSQGFGGNRAWALKRSSLLYFLGEFT